MNNRLLLKSISALSLAVPTLADWDPGTPNTKWIQMPQLVGGYDVLSMDGVFPGGGLVNKVVADDWQCNDPRPITDIHVWGSWWQDHEFLGQTFQLKIYADIPAGPGTAFSRPGAELWSVSMTPTVRLWGTGNELFYDPNGVLPPTPETEVWQYNFILNPSQYFQQTPGTVYWLSVQASAPPPGHAWGWKTSDQHWNDDAAWRDVVPPTDWMELRDPLDPTTPARSLDMAFVLTVPEPRTQVLVAGVALIGFAACRRGRS